MTAVTTTFSGQAYGNGVYTMTYSSNMIGGFQDVKNAMNGLEGSYTATFTDGGYWQVRAVFILLFILA